MDLDFAKSLDGRMWLLAKLGVILCFGLASALLAVSLYGPSLGLTF